MLTLVAAILGTSPAYAAPPTPYSVSTTKDLLETLIIEDEHDDSGYSRDLFNHWITISGTCNTRETVLKRDGSNIVTNSSCAAISGSWFSKYDGVTLTSSSSVDVDHIVPLAEAWRSGADEWSSDRREDFANDLDVSQLIAVSASSNRSKGDQDPSEWLPSVASYHCTYARMWIWVKYYYGLSIDQPEYDALRGILYSEC
ncbi:HNH endonuclease family protein [Streptomyces sp. NPDC002659]|uniref:HNH endonuclease family protein n=1 Tax=Streptomyces sp. NPDC002659 TaxID=3364656 RepID=UPI00368F189B